MIFERIIRLPWWLYAAVSAVFLTLALVGGDWAKERGSAIREVMERPSAPVTSFDELAMRDPAYTEAAFEAQVIAEMVRPIEGTGALQDVGVILPLAAPEATEAPERPAVVAVILEAGPSGWRELIAPFATSDGALGPVLSIEGEVRDMAPEWRAGEQVDAGGLGPVLWVLPYYDGREAALERNLGLLGWGALPFWGIGIFFAAMSAARFFATRS